MASGSSPITGSWPPKALAGPQCLLETSSPFQTPPTRLCKNCRILGCRGNFAPCPLTRKFLLPLPSLLTPSQTPSPKKSLASVLNRETLVSGLEVSEGVLAWGLQRRGWGQVLSTAEGGKKKKSRKSHRLHRKKNTHNHFHFGFAAPTELQPCSGGDRSCSFIAVEERTRKMLTAFMRCGINNNRLRLYCVL